jgi:uncharacterized protein YyaL (SSP411 family)
VSAEPVPGQHTNRLAAESSPYLLQHAHNPVDWYAWGPEAFEAARKQGKLVFLSIGYSSCHWCHVMERESFENADVAKLLNDGFVSIKVDREERPDIDAIYMTALNIQGERGGWPLSMFLTADGKPIVGGTYWPAEDRTVQGQTLHGFKSILSTIHRMYQEKPKAFEEQAARLADATRDALAESIRGRAIVDLKRDLVQAAVQGVKEEFDPVYGGFGAAERKFRGSKFPQPSYLQLLLHQSPAELDPVLAVTLDRMARGGIYDQLGGGFHRYSTERTWTVPHFEKMLYDNAQLVEVYAQAYGKTHNRDYARIVDETLGFIGREMTSPQGAFYSALDADSAGAEGQFYVWTPEEIDRVLTDPEEAALLKRVYGVKDKPNFEDKSHILVLTEPPTEQQLARLASARQKLFAARAKRPRPFLDTKILTAWNGQMIGGYAVAGRILGKPDYIGSAARAADFILKNMRTKEGKLTRTCNAKADVTTGRLNAYLDDYAFLTHGLLCLHDATGEQRWLDESRSLTDAMVELFEDRTVGGFFYTSNDHEKLFARSKDQFDSAIPSGNSVATRDLLRIWLKTKDDRYHTLAEKNLRTFAGSLKTNPTALTATADALAIYLDQPAVQKAEAHAAPLLLVRAGTQQVKAEDLLKLKATAKPEKPDADGKQEVVLTITIEKGWHLYANPPGPAVDETSATILEIGAEMKPADVKVTYPKGKLVDDSVVGKYFIYEDKVELKATVKRAPGDTSPLELTVKFQACNESTCLVPSKKKIKVP